MRLETSKHIVITHEISKKSISFQRFFFYKYFISKVTSIYIYIDFISRHCTSDTLDPQTKFHRKIIADKPRISPNAMKMKIGNYKGCIKVARHSNSIAYLQKNNKRVEKCIKIVIK